MPLIKYMQYITLPDGSPAAEMSIPIHLVGGSVLVPLFADKAAVTPLANPVTTDQDGLAEFYAAPGAFCAELAGSMFHLMVAADEPDDAWPGTFVHEQVSPASVWTIGHHFGVTPAATILVGGQSVEADVTHPDAETTVITFSAPTVGVALLRR